MTAVRVRQSAGQASCSGQRCSQGSSIQRCKITSEGFPYGISTEFSQFFREPPIEPVRTISVRSSCHWRHVFLVALAWGKRASEIHAFSGRVWRCVWALYGSAIPLFSSRFLDKEPASSHPSPALSHLSSVRTTRTDRLLGRGSAVYLFLSILPMLR